VLGLKERVSLAKLSPSETSIVGHWISTTGKVTGDEACQRIHELTTVHLTLVARSPDGWSSLYRDPSDSRLWEHTILSRNSKAAVQRRWCTLRKSRLVPNTALRPNNSFKPNPLRGSA
jgi:hypothetical protein